MRGLRRPIPPTRAALLGTLLGALLGVSCGDAEPADAAGPPAPEPPAARHVRDLVAAVTPLAPHATPGAQNDWHRRRRETLARLRDAGPAVGEEALALYERDRHASVEVRAALLDVAAHAIPARATPVLSGLVETYGPDPDLRAEATRLLAVAAPERAFELLRAPLLETRPDQSWPHAEVLLSAWIAAGRELGEDLSEELVAVATNIFHGSEARHRAVRELGEEQGPRVEQALEEVLIEPTGNAYLRRLAAQSILKVMGPRACPILARVADREADGQFLLFLQDMLGKNCS